jgi:hypothetical protein
MSRAVAGYQQPAAGGAPPADAPRAVEVEKLKDNLFVLKGGGGRTAVIQANGVTVVDTKLPAWDSQSSTRSRS